MRITPVGAIARLSLIANLVLISIGTAWGEEIPGRRLAGVAGVRESTAEIMQRQAVSPPREGERPEHELEYPERDGLPQNPAAPAVASLPAVPSEKAQAEAVKIHTTAGSFDGATLTDTGAFPPDSMGTAGPTCSSPR